MVGRAALLYARTRQGLMACAVVLACLIVRAVDPPIEALPPFDPTRHLSDQERDDRLQRVQPGVSPDRVRQLLGAPSRTARQILYRRSREQWLYEAPFSVRLDFEYVRGQEPHLLSVQAVRAGKP
jgi:hypothetical protein